MMNGPENVDAQKLEGQKVTAGNQTIDEIRDGLTKAGEILADSTLNKADLNSLKEAINNPELGGNLGERLADAMGISTEELKNRDDILTAISKAADQITGNKNDLVSQQAEAMREFAASKGLEISPIASDEALSDLYSKYFKNTDAIENYTDVLLKAERNS